MDSPKPHLPQADFRGVSLLSLVIWGFITSNANRARLSTTKRRTGSGAQLEVSLHADAIHANLYCTYDAEVLGVFGEHRREHARDNISNLPVSSNGCLRQRVRTGLPLRQMTASARMPVCQWCWRAPRA